MNELITIQSAYSVKETIDRFASILTSKGVKIFARIDHGGNAINEGMLLRPTELLIFGNPKAGTLLMQDKQTAGIDLPLKALAWQDELEKVWLTYNDMKWILDRHNFSEKTFAIAKTIEEGMILAINAATKK